MPPLESSLQLLCISFFDASLEKISINYVLAVMPQLLSSSCGQRNDICN